MKTWCTAAIILLALGASAPADPSGLTGAFNAAAYTSFSLQQAETSTTETTELKTFSLDGPSYLLSSEPLFGDTEILWPGFLTGMRSKHSFHKKFAQPLGNPLYFESPFIETNVRLLYLWHDFSTASQLAGGEANIVAAQARIALTDRLAFIATKNNYSWLKTGITPEADGWNDLAAGLKYAFLVDEANELVLTGGLRWEWHNGSRDVLMGGDSGDNELSPFISFAKGWDRFHLIGDLAYRIPMDRHDGNHILHWDVHFDYEIAPDALPGFFPLLEIHGLHYLSDADQLPLGVGGLDYSNFGSSDVAGTSVLWGDLGFRWKLTPNLSFGAAYGFPITNPADDAFNQRVTVDFIISF
ncbi:MAG: hypothetical protein GY842_28520 [bacterium]|nr:hypothetical protein [bacterium]